MNTGIAQDMSAHNWKNRVVIVLAEDLSNTLAQGQIKEFTKDSEGLKERKIVVYQCSPTGYKKGIGSTGPMEASEKMFQQYKASDSNFEIVLIGLDGGIKLRQNDLLTNNKLFDLIDSMPMRMAEMRRKKNSH